MMSFKGFRRGDFGRIKGTNWRAKLGPELANVLKSMYNDSTFIHEIPYAGKNATWGELYLRHGRWYIKYRHAAYHVVTTPQELMAGLKIEKGLQNSEDPMEIYNVEWDWKRFEDRLLSEDKQLMGIMQTLPGKGITIIVNDGFKDHLVIKNAEELRELKKVIEKWPKNSWCNLYFWRIIPRDDVLEMGYFIIDEISQVFDTLRPVYDLVTGYGQT